MPLESYDQTLWGNVAAVYTTMTHFDGPLRMLLKKRPSGKYFALITPVCEMTADTAMPTYTKRWRIENFFAENAFLGMNHLPSLNLNAIQTMLSLRLLAFHEDFAALRRYMVEDGLLERSDGKYWRSGGTFEVD